MEKKSKIEIGKLGKLGRVSRGNHTWWIIDELNLIIEKQSEIIDYLNSQSKEEESTPEQKEEWEEEFMEVLETFKDEICSNFFASSKPLTDFIKQLLLDREREAQIEVLTDIFQTCYQEDSKTLELVEEKLSKLTTK